MPPKPLRPGGRALIVVVGAILIVAPGGIRLARLPDREPPASSPSPAIQEWQAIPPAAGACRPISLPAIGRTVAVADTFERGRLSKWHVVQDGDAFAGTTRDDPFDGNISGRLRATAARTSRANIQTRLADGTAEVWASGSFRVDDQGRRESNVPTFRFFNGTARVLDVFRQNVTGQLFLRTTDGPGDWDYVKLQRRMDIGRWYRIDIHVRALLNRSTISIAVNGRTVYQTSTAELHVRRLTTVMIGSEHVQQVMDLAFDDVVVNEAGRDEELEHRPPPATAEARTCSIATRR